MATGTTARTGSETLQSIFVTALRNTHALETEALQIMNRQVERLERYPEMEQKLRQHIRETEGQQRRIEEALHALGEDRSLLKEAVMGFMGNLAALAHSPAGDEILKNTFANQAFENYEIAAYKSLIAITEAAGQSRFLTGFQQSLREEEAMARFISENVEAITRKYLAFEEQGAKADR
ncbi:MAG TPA: ferritin-like domain-containing protein [Beijerinckiaceae bacterium]|jgi:ferritin-like metal-binding protein YciE